MSIKSRLEDIFFSVIQHLPIVPGFLMNWTNDYLNRRITQLQHETIRQQWDKASPWCEFQLPVERRCRPVETGTGENLQYG